MLVQSEKMVQRKEKSEFVQLLKAAANGNPDAMYQLGDIYACGKCGEKRDIELADYWYKKAALSCEQWYRQILDAANHGEPEAMFNMGQIYEAGKYGKNINLKIAANWYKQAAENNHIEAAERLNALKSSVYNRINNKHLTSGEVYHLVYYTMVNGHRGSCCEGNLTCVKEEAGKYLLQRANGEQFWIGCDDVESLLEGEPGGKIAAYAENTYWKIFNRVNPEHAKPQLAEEPVPLEPVKQKNNT